VHDSLPDRVPDSSLPRLASPDLAQVVMAAGLAVAVTDLRGQVQEANEAFAELLHSRRDALLGRKVAEILTAGGDVSIDLDRVVADLSAGAATVVEDILVRREDTTSLRAQVVCSLAPAGADDTPVVLLHLFDTEQQSRRHDGGHDPLTHLRTRSAVLADLGARLQGGAGLLGVLTCDIDRFRMVNESLGHAVGDQVLVTLARRLIAGVRAGDTAARLGDDEFVVVLAGLTDTDEAVDVARRLTRSLAAPLEVATDDGAQEIRCAVSTGLAVVDLESPCPVHHALDAATLLRDANTALDAAKASGGARCRVFTDAMRERAVRRLSVENDLRRALDRGELRVHYQPVVHLADGRRTGFEALVRWAHPTRGLLLPGQFLDVAQDTGLLTAVDAVVLEEALDFLARHPDVRVAVNTSATRLDGTFASSVARGLRRRGLRPDRLAVELLETSLVAGDAVTERELRELADLGVAVLLDDFGTGYSALSYLRRLPVTGLKLDRSFVVDLPQDPGSDRISEAVARLASSFGLDSICEGVETAAQAQHVAAQGWESAQGFYFGVPAPEDRWFPRPEEDPDATHGAPVGISTIVSIPA